MLTARAHNKIPIIQMSEQKLREGPERIWSGLDWEGVACGEEEEIEKAGEKNVTNK